MDRLSLYYLMYQMSLLDLSYFIKRQPRGDIREEIGGSSQSVSVQMIDWQTSSSIFRALLASQCIDLVLICFVWSHLGPLEKKLTTRLSC